MDDNQFQKIVLEKLEKNDKFQSMALEYMAKLTQQLVELQSGQQRLEGCMDRLESRMDSLESRMTKLELKVEHEVVGKLKAIYEKVDGIDQRLSDSEEEIKTLKRVR